MEKTVSYMNLLEVLVYLDDVIVFGKKLEEHEDCLRCSTGYSVKD